MDTRTDEASYGEILQFAGVITGVATVADGLKLETELLFALALIAELFPKELSPVELALCALIAELFPKELSPIELALCALIAELFPKELSPVELVLSSLVAELFPKELSE